jgi:pyruvate formate lyase activating enzyme
VGEELPPNKIVDEAVEHSCQSIAYTYTEPTIFFEYAYDTAQLAHEKGIKNIFVTNGFATKKTINKMASVIDAANIDLKSFSNDYYRKVCGAKLQPVLDSIKAMHEAGIWIEVTTLVVPDQNDSQKELTEIAEFIASVSTDIPWHISRFFPQYKMDDTGPTPIETLTSAYDIGREVGLHYVYMGNVAPDYYSNTECSQGHTVIKRDGCLVENRAQDGGCPECDVKIAGVFS